MGGVQLFQIKVQLLHTIVQQSQLRVPQLLAIVQQSQLIYNKNVHRAHKCDHSKCDLKDNRQTCCNFQTRAMPKSLLISIARSWVVTRALWCKSVQGPALTF